MSPTFQSLGIDRLPLEERLALADQLWKSVEDDVNSAPLTDAQRAELDRRLRDTDAHPEKGGILGGTS